MNRNSRVIVVGDDVRVSRSSGLLSAALRCAAPRRAAARWNVSARQSVRDTDH